VVDNTVAAPVAVASAPVAAAPSRQQAEASVNYKDY